MELVEDDDTFVVVLIGLFEESFAFASTAHIETFSCLHADNTYSRSRIVDCG